jgi:voltage-gated potassium channel
VRIRSWAASGDGFAALTPAALVALAALLPSLIAPGVSNLMLLRTLRLMRILRVARLGRFSLAMRHMTEAVFERREELLLSLMLVFIVVVFSAATMYVLEGEDDPLAFGSVPRALWWSVCTLTTAGYGDIYLTACSAKSAAGSPRLPELA